MHSGADPSLETKKETKSAKRRVEQVVYRETRYDNVAYHRLQFLKVISHSLGSTRTTEALQMTSENDSDADNDTSSQEPVISSNPSVSATATVTAAAASDNICKVCLIARRHGDVLVPCGHSRFYCNCEDTVADMPDGCHVSRIKQYLHSCPEQRNSVRHIPGPDFQLPVLCTR